jgi:hypothetical protein
VVINAAYPEYFGAAAVVGLQAGRMPAGMNYNVRLYRIVLSVNPPLAGCYGWVTIRFKMVMNGKRCSDLLN